MSVSILSILETLDRAHNGPLCPVKEWNINVIPSKVSKMLDEYDLRGTCDPENPINTDDSLADRYYEAAFQLALDIGMLCQDTERIIEVTEDELANAIRNAPSQLNMGEGMDQVVLKSRDPEDEYPPLCRAPLGTAVSEDIWVQLHHAIVQHREIDIFQGGTIPTIFGRRVLAGTPYETLAGRYQAQLTKEVLWRAGRPGMPVTGITTSPTAFGQLGGFGIEGGLNPATNNAFILAPGELLTAYTVLHKVVHAINCNAKFRIAFASMIGGYPGPPEGAALAQIAAMLLHFAIHHCHYGGTSSHDPRYQGNCGREGLWVQGITIQAISRNTHLMGTDVMSQVAGPCTEMILYESASAMLAVSTSGASGVCVARSSGSKYMDYLTPLEMKFCAEVLKRSAGMTRKKANEIVKVLIPKYENDLQTPPKGKSFRECYDLETLKPTKEWFDIYLKVKKELIELGVPLDFP